MKQKLFLEEIEHLELMSKNHRKVCITASYIVNFLIFASAITGGILVSAFAFLLSIPIETASSAIGLNICATARGIKNYKSIK